MKAILTLAAFFILIVGLQAASPMLLTTQNVATGGIGLGSILAIVLSWSRNSSILWAIIHALFGWLYVIYFVFTR